MDDDVRTRPEVVAPAGVGPTRMLRALRDRPGLVALVGDWHGGDTVVAVDPVRVLGPGEDPFAALGAGGPPAPGQDRDPHGDRVFGGGWIGWLGYQLARDLERLPPAPPRAATLPDHHLARYDHVLRRRAATGEWVLEALPGADPARVRRTAEAVAAGLAAPDRPRDWDCGPFAADASGEEHAAAVRRALGHIRDGDVFQVNVCRTLEASFAGDPLDLFCAGQERLRPRFAAFLRGPDGSAVVSLSPELFLRRTGTDVLTSPIKGTAAADTDPAALHASAKNRAENVMIVDLMRNDLSRVCVPGSVRAPREPRVEPHTGVHHLVADVRGRLRPGLDDGDLLRASFPPGSCTGAPKIRAMGIVNDLEPAARGVYTGAVGFAGPLAGLALNVAIRTFEFSGGRVRLGVGGGVVADSDPADETRETLVKAAPLLAAVGARLAAPAPPDPARGVFTTLPVRDGAPVGLDEHLARLGRSVRALWDAPLPSRLREQVHARAAALAGPHRLRVTVVPGPGGPEATVVTAPLGEDPGRPWRLVPLELPGGLGGHKWADRRVLEETPGPWGPVCDPLLVEPDGTLLEAGRASVFVVSGGRVRTPPADGRILPGVQRARVLARLRAEGAEVAEEPVRLAELAAADEVFVTNALRGVRPVGVVDGAGAWAPGPVAVRLARTLGTAPAGPEAGTGAAAAARPVPAPVGPAVPG
ncbi:chorismate-binding protein [Kocuria flava]|uniref:chorismate-binding protein n=1 Tax=Kocuria flava TaxID=446860 RepID=UPI000A6F6D44|nr:bifunctional anthranilate synthase component I family protein/class IV aminotransferase [Kocuria flava]